MTSPSWIRESSIRPGILQLVVFLEKTFGIQVKDEELIPENLDSLKGISNFLQSKQAALPGAGKTQTS